MLIQFSENINSSVAYRIILVKMIMHFEIHLWLKGRIIAPCIIYQ